LKGKIDLVARGHVHYFLLESGKELKADRVYEYFEERYCPGIRKGIERHGAPCEREQGRPLPWNPERN